MRGTLPTAEAGSTTPLGARQMWTHFGFLVALAIGLYLVGRSMVGGAGGLATTFSTLPRFLFSVIPVAAGLAAGASLFNQHALRDGARMALVVPVLMLVLESGLGPALHPTPMAPPEVAADQAMSASEETIVNGAGSVRVLMDLVAEGRLQEARQASDRYDFGHPRVLLAEAGRRLLALLAPFILIGLAIGISSWMQAKVRFVGTVDARFAQLLVAWTVIPLAWTVLDMWTEVNKFSALFEGGTIATLLIPHIAFGLLAALGWRAARGMSRTLES